MHIGKEILKEAKAKSVKVCDKYLETIKISKGYAGLCAMYFNADDWTLENDIPGKNFISIHREGIYKFNMFAHCTGVFLNLPKAAFLNGSKCSIEYDSYNIGKLIIRHDANLSLIARGNSIVSLTCLDEAFLDLETQDLGQITVFVKGPNVQIKSKGNVKIINSDGNSSL